MNLGEWNPRPQDSAWLASVGTPPAAPSWPLAPVGILLSPNMGGDVACLLSPTTHSPSARGDISSGPLEWLALPSSAPSMPGPCAETKADLREQEQEQEQEHFQPRPQQQALHHHHQSQQQLKQSRILSGAPFAPAPWTQQLQEQPEQGGSRGREVALGTPRAGSAPERSEVAVLGGPGEDASGWTLCLEHNSILQQEAPDMQARVLIKRAKDGEQLFQDTVPNILLKSPHCYDLQVRFGRVDRRLIMRNTLRVSLFKRDGSLCDPDRKPILSDQEIFYVLQEDNGEAYGSTRSALPPFRPLVPSSVSTRSLLCRLRFNTTSYHHRGSAFFLQLTMSDLLGNVLAFLVSLPFFLYAKRPVGAGGGRRITSNDCTVATSRRVKTNTRSSPQPRIFERERDMRPQGLLPLVKSGSFFLCCHLLILFPLHAQPWETSQAGRLSACYVQHLRPLRGWRPAPAQGAASRLCPHPAAERGAGRSCAIAISL